MSYTRIIIALNRAFSLVITLCGQINVASQMALRYREILRIFKHSILILMDMGNILEQVILSFAKKVDPSFETTSRLSDFRCW
jgi:hypothetical protein